MHSILSQPFALPFRPPVLQDVTRQLALVTSHLTLLIPGSHCFHGVGEFRSKVTSACGLIHCCNVSTHREAKRFESAASPAMDWAQLLKKWDYRSSRFLIWENRSKKSMKWDFGSQERERSPCSPLLVALPAKRAAERWVNVWWGSTWRSWRCGSGSVWQRRRGTAELGIRVRERVRVWRIGTAHVRWEWHHPLSVSKKSAAGLRNGQRKEWCIAWKCDSISTPTAAPVCVCVCGSRDGGEERRRMRVSGERRKNDSSRDTMAIHSEAVNCVTWQAKWVWEKIKEYIQPWKSVKEETQSSLRCHESYLLRVSSVRSNFTSSAAMCPVTDDVIASEAVITMTIMVRICSHRRLLPKGAFILNVLPTSRPHSAARDRKAEQSQSHWHEDDIMNAVMQSDDLLN